MRYSALLTSKHNLKIYRAKKFNYAAPRSMFFCFRRDHEEGSGSCCFKSTVTYVQRSCWDCPSCIQLFRVCWFRFVFPMMAILMKFFEFPFAPTATNLPMNWLESLLFGLLNPRSFVHKKTSIMVRQVIKEVVLLILPVTLGGNLRWREEKKCR